MSNTTDYTVNPLVYEYARQEAKARAREQWETENFNMWTTYNQTLNPDWKDPWFESETAGIYNGPSTGPGDPAWEMTQNLYMAYCWLMYKGYNKYSAMALMLSAIQESTITGGLWEQTQHFSANNLLASNHPYSSLIGFDATQTAESGYAYTWYYGGTKPAYDNGTIVTWTAEFTDYSGYRWTKQAVAGSWDAVMEYPIKTKRVMIDGVGLREMPVEYESGNLVFDTDRPRAGRGDGRGYGFCQWTPWNKLPRLCAYAANQGDVNFTDGNKHWQVNASLQLAIWEYERYLSMTTPQSGSSYMGQWIDSNAAILGDYGAYFSWPYPGTGYTRHYYGQSISWDDFAAGTYLTWFENYLQTMADPPTTEEDIDWCRRQLALAIYRACFLQATYADFNFQVKSKYIISAFNYWGNGWDIRDVPRPRDIPHSELDAYHGTPIRTMIALTQGRRRCKNVCSVLL